MLTDIGALTVLIGPNNAGKSSIMQALLRLSEHFRSLPGNDQPWTKYNKVHSKFVLDGILKLEIPWNDFNLPARVDHRIGFVFNSQLQRPEYYIRFFNSDGSSQITDPVDLYAGGNWARIGPQGYSSFYESMAKMLGKPINTEEPVQAIKNYLYDYFCGFFYLAHNRDSIFEDSIQYRQCLDPKAEHLASRLDQLISEQRPDFRQNIDHFMNTVIPGLGHIVTNRKQGSNDTTVSISFDDGKNRIPLEDLGGGVTHVLSIAAVLLGEPKATLLLLEEPESHLHEGAQRRLIEQIRNNMGTKQVMIATHSPIFMDKAMASSVYYIIKLNEKSVVEKRIEDEGQYKILDELGVHPSTLLQSNCVIWIEGPTEKILLKHWLSLWAPEILEHDHYSFVMSSGSCLAHYTTELASKEDMIKIPKICRNSFVIADRDNSPDKPPSKDWVQRLVTEIKKTHPEAVWITDFYEIEWYYPKSVCSRLWSKIDWDKLEQLRKEDKPFFEALQMAAEAGAQVKSASGRKTHWASLAIENKSIDDWFGSAKNNQLAVQIEKLANFVRKANSLNQNIKHINTCPACSQPIRQELSQLKS